MTDQNAHEILKILGHAMGSSKSWFEEKGLIAGYHSFNLNGKKYKGQRDPQQRLDKFQYDFSNKIILDIGCSSGGILFSLANVIKQGFGLDISEKYINAANALKAANGATNVHFYTFNLDKENHEIISSLALGNKIDLCFFMNLALWVSRWKEALQYCASISKEVIFEAHGNDAQKKEQIDYIKSIFSNVVELSKQSEDDPTYSSREMFLCSGYKKVRKSDNQDSKKGYLYEDSQLKITKDLINELCQKHIGLNEEIDIQLELRSKESVIIEVNNKYIIKFPKAYRGKNWNLQEKSITDFLREKVRMPIPRTEIGSIGEIDFLWYEKIIGKDFTYKIYSSFDSSTQENAIKQIAQFFHDLHKIKVKTASNIQFKPSWEFKENSLDITKELVSKELGILISEAEHFHKNYKLNKEDEVIGHFDLHDNNILADNHQISGIIDFGNCKIGDLHQDLAMLNTISPVITEKVLKEYKKISDKKVDESKIKYFTILYLANVIADFHKAKNVAETQRWVNFFNNLYGNKSQIQEMKVQTNISSEWKKWVLENILLGQTPKNLIKTMVEKGLDQECSTIAVNEIVASPYFAVANKYKDKLQRREWLLKTLDDHKRSDESYTKPKKVPLPPFKQFLEEYYFQNKIGIFSGAIDHWGASKWTFPELVEKVGYDSVVEVQCGREKEAEYEINGPKLKTEIKFGEFIDKITAGNSSNDMYMTANNHPFKNPAMQKLLSDFDNIGDGYFDMDKFTTGAFLWLGPKGVITPLHHDLTNNFFIQIYGKKVYHMIPSMQVPYIYNNKHVYSDIKLLESDLSKFPEFSKANIIEINLEAGDSLFIPIGYWHHVVGLTENISLTLTNMNVKNYWPGHI